MVIVHVWDSAWTSYLPRGASGSPGHASIQLSPSATTPLTGYASLHPGSSGPFACLSREFKSLNQDVSHYRSARQRHSKWRICGLDEDAMRKAWSAIRRGTRWYCGNPRKTIFTCSTLVHELLVAGNADKFAKGWGSWVVGTWSPDDIRAYVEAILKKIRCVAG